MAAMVPRIVATIMAMTETSSVVARLFKIRVSEKRSAYQWKEKPVQTVRLLESLKEKMISTRMGAYMKISARIMHTRANTLFFRFIAAPPFPRRHRTGS